MDDQPHDKNDNGRRKLSYLNLKIDATNSADCCSKWKKKGKKKKKKDDDVVIFNGFNNVVIIVEDDSQRGIQR